MAMYWLRISLSLTLFLSCSVSHLFAATPQSLTYQYFGSPSSYLTQVTAAGSALSIVSPSYFDLATGGVLQRSWKIDPAYIAELQRRGMKVVPFVSNHWDRANGIAALSSPQREAVIADLVAAVQEYQLDGLQLDIEGVGSTYRNAFTEFTRLLREALPADRSLSVAVAANPNGWTTGWHGFYDYVALAPFVDYLMIMSYDESWEGGPAGPVASLSFIQRSFDYATVRLGIPASKIMLGIPFYGRLWKTDGPNDEGVTLAGIGVSHNRVASLVSKYSATAVNDPLTQSVRIEFTIPPGQSEYIAGKRCSAGTYVLWTDDESTLKLKLRYIQSVQALGVGTWSLSQQAASTWSFWNTALQGKLFADVDLTHWAADPISRVNELQWMQGTTSSTFSPASSLSRAQAASILVRALKLTLQQAAHIPTFADIDAHWAQSDIVIAASNGIVMGMTATEFRPNEPITREQLAALLTRALNVSLNADEATAPLPYVDISAADWSYGSIQAMVQRGFMNGVSPSLFGRKQMSTRAQMAVLLERLQPLIAQKASQTSEGG